jgi:hypothetical protein
MANPLVTDDLVDFLLEDVVGLDELLALPHFAEHSRETCGMFVGAARRVAREVLFPVYGAMDKAPPHLEGTEVHLHPAMRSAYGALVELGILSASRGPEVGGAQLPFTVAAAATTYLMAGNLSVYGVAALTSGAARLIESFGTDEQREVYMRRMYSGEWAGTMALTEPHAGSSLSDVRTRAEPAGDHYKISGTKVFISGGEHDLTENIVHLALARIDGAPPGTKGVSLFLIPKLRPEGSRWVPNDVTCTGVFDKVGWKAFPSVQLSYRRGRRLPRLAGGPAQPGPGADVPADERGAPDGGHERRGQRLGGPPLLARVRARPPAGPPAGRQGSARAPGAHHRARRRAPDAAAPEGHRGRWPRALVAHGARRRPGRARPRRGRAARGAPAARAAHPHRQDLPRRVRVRGQHAGHPDPRRLRLHQASTCPRPGGAIRSSTPSTRARPASRPWICWAARSSPTAAQRRACSTARSWRRTWART